MRGLRKIAKPKKPGRRFPDREDSAHLERVRAMPCLLRGKRCKVNRWRGVYPDVQLYEDEYAHVCSGKVEAHHVTSKARGGHDTDTVPLCRHAHQLLHSIGHVEFCKLWGVDLSAEASKLSPVAPPKETE